MARVPTFQARASRREPLTVTPVRNAGASYQAMAAAAGAFAAEMGSLADRAAAVEGEASGLQFGAIAALPEQSAIAPQQAPPAIPPKQTVIRAGSPATDRHPGVNRQVPEQEISSAPPNPPVPVARTAATATAIAPSSTAIPAGALPAGVAASASMHPLIGTLDGASRPQNRSALKRQRDMLAGPLAVLGSRFEARFGKKIIVNDAIAKRGTTREQKTPGSRHFHGDALDLNIRHLSPDEQLELFRMAMAAGFTGYGFGRGILHVDMGEQRAWRYGNATFGNTGVSTRRLIAEVKGARIPKPQAPGAAPELAAAADAPIRVAQASIEPEAGSAATDAPAFSSGNIFTIRGRAFDRAARSVYGDRLDLQVRGAIDDLRLQHDGDPAALEAAIDSYTAGVSGGIDDVRLRVATQQLAGRLKFAAVREASRKAESERKAIARATFNDDFAARRTSIIRMARTAGEDDDASQAIADELSGFEAFVDSQQDLTPGERQKLTAQLTQDVFSARILGNFDRVQSPAARAAFQQNFVEAWQAGKGGAAELSPETFDKVNNSLRSQIAADKRQADAELRLVKQQANQLRSRLKAGHALPPAELEALRNRAALSGEPGLGAAVEFLDRAVTWQGINRQARPDHIEKQIAVMEAEMDARGASPAALEMIDIMQGLHKTIERGVKADPLSLAERVGIAEVPPLDVSSMDNLTASLITRAAVADQVAEHYAIEPRFFKPGEIQALEAGMADDPEFLPAFARSLSEAFGDQDIRPALREISKEAPLIAHAAGVADVTQNDRILHETAQAIRNRALPDFKPVTIAPEQQRAMTRGEVGSALMALPGLEGAAMQQAGLLFEVRAHGRAIEAKSTDRGTVDLWEGAIQEALGRHVVDGETRGGVDDVNGQMTLIPPEMSADTLEDMLDRLSDADLAGLSPVGSANDLRITAGQIADGKLVAAGHGKYFVALGDPLSDDPRWVPAADGTRWILDVFTLSAVQRLRNEDSSGQAQQSFIGVDSP